MKTIAQQLNVKEFPFEIKDKNGNVIYFENSDGYWWKREWKDGNVIYFENSKGNWYKKEYKDGKRVYREDSEGYWSKTEYKDGNVIYREDSEGVIIDNRPKQETEMTISELEKLTGIKNLKIVK